MAESRDRILDAAERVILRDGVARLTLDAVAAEANLSKGGLLYHFASKDDLVRGMMRRLLVQFEAEVKRLEEQDPNPVGRKLRARLNAGFPRDPAGAAAHCDRVAAALLAAVATNRSLLADMQDYSARVEKELLDDGIDPILAMIINMAADGIWLRSLLGIPNPSGELRDQILDRLRLMTTVPATPGPVESR